MRPSDQNRPCGIRWLSNSLDSSSSSSFTPIQLIVWINTRSQLATIKRGPFVAMQLYSYTLLSTPYRLWLGKSKRPRDGGGLEQGLRLWWCCSDKSDQNERSVVLGMVVTNCVTMMVPSIRRAGERARRWLSWTGIAALQWFHYGRIIIFQITREKSFNIIFGPSQRRRRLAIWF